jgi:hypothetical protein
MATSPRDPSESKWLLVKPTKCSSCLWLRLVVLGFALLNGRAQHWRNTSPERLSWSPAASVRSRTPSTIAVSVSA